MAAIVFMAMNVFTTLKGDEYVYAMMPGDTQLHCRTLADYVSSIPTFYQTTNGRLADALERLMASLVGKPVFNLLNTIMFILFVDGIFTLAVGRRRSVTALALVLALVLVAFPYPGETLLWMAGACNYLWSVTLTLWLLCWLRYAPGRMGWFGHLMVALLAFVVGGFNESTSVGCWLGMAIYFALNRSQFTPPRRTALIACALGVLMVLMSPALAGRLQGGNSVNMDLSLMQMVSRRVLAVGFMTLRFVTPLLVLLLVGVCWHRRGWKAVRSHPGFCLMAGVVLAALAFGMVIERPYTFMVTLAMAIVLAAAFDWLQALRPRLRTTVTALCLMACAVFSAHALTRIVTYCNYDRQVQSRIEHGPAQCVIEASRPPVTSRWIVPDVYDNSELRCAYRSFYAYYYGKQNVQFLPADMLRRYHDGTLLDGATVWHFASDDPDCMGNVLAVPGTDYGFVQMPDHDPAINGKGRVYYDDIEQMWGEDVARRRRLLGSYRDYLPIRPYALVIKGKKYMVIGSAITDNVERIELSRYDIERKQWRNLTLTRGND